MYREKCSRVSWETLRTWGIRDQFFQNTHENEGKKLNNSSRSAQLFLFSLAAYLCPVTYTVFPKSFIGMKNEYQ